MLPCWDWQSASFFTYAKSLHILQLWFLCNSKAAASILCACVKVFIPQDLRNFLSYFTNLTEFNDLVWVSRAKQAFLTFFTIHPPSHFIPSFSSHRIFDIVYVTLRCYYTKKAYVIVYLKPHILKYFNIQVLCKIHFLLQISLNTYYRITYKQ